MQGAFHKASLEENDISICSSNNPQFENRGKSVRVMVEQEGLPTSKKTIILPYDESNTIQLSPVVSVKNHPSIRAIDISTGPILKAIENSEQLLASEDDLLSFLGYAKFKTIGFFSIKNDSYLVMLMPEEFALNRSYSCHLISDA